MPSSPHSADRRRPHLRLRAVFAGLLISVLAAMATGQSKPPEGGDSIQRGLAALNAGNFEAAEASFRVALQREPRNAHVWKALGVVFAAQGLHDLASEPFQKACSLNPNEPDACYYLARNHYLVNRFEESLQIFDRLAAANDEDWRYANGRGLALMALSRYAEATEAFQAAMKLENGRASLEEKPAINLGSLYSRSGEPGKAVQVLQKVVNQNPNAARAWFELGKVQVQLGEIPAARDSLQNALRIRQNYPEAHLLLAKVYVRLGEPEKARTHQQRGMRAGPVN